MGKINSRAKGAAGEREFRDFLVERDHTARRGQQFSGGHDSPDVVSDLDDVVHWEVKRVESLRLYDALEQAKRDAKVTQIPIVVHRQSHKEWVAILRADDLVRIIECYAQHAGG